MSISPKYILGSLRFFPALSHSVCWLIATPWTVAHQASLPMGFSRQEYGGVLPCHLSEHRPQPGSEPPSPVSPALAGGLLPAEPTFNPSIKSYLLSAPQRNFQGLDPTDWSPVLNPNPPESFKKHYICHLTSKSSENGGENSPSCPQIVTLT